MNIPPLPYVFIEALVTLTVATLAFAGVVIATFGRLLGIWLKHHLEKNEEKQTSED